LPRRSRPCLWLVDSPAKPRRGGSCAPPSAERQKAVVRRYYEDVLTGRRVDVLEQLIAPGFVGHDPVGARMDRSGYIDAVRMWHDGFRRMAVRIDDQVTEGRLVTTRWSATGTHTGRFVGIEPTGREVTMSGIDIHRLEGDRLVELWEQLDLASLLAQML
jgi:predicted ester cyclase